MITSLQYVHCAPDYYPWLSLTSNYPSSPLIIYLLYVTWCQGLAGLLPLFCLAEVLVCLAEESSSSWSRLCQVGDSCCSCRDFPHATSPLWRRSSRRWDWQHLLLRWHIVHMSRWPWHTKRLCRDCIWTVGYLPKRGGRAQSQTVK